jgi:hypothetical protein
MDGTLLKNDFFEELFFKRLLEAPFSLVKYLFKKNPLLLLKQDLLNDFHFNYPVDFLTNQEVLNYLIDNKNSYEGVILISASPDSFVKRLFAHLGIFTEIHGSIDVNLKGKKKLDFIFKNKYTPFAYIGNDESDKIIYASSFNPMEVIKGKLYQVKKNA